jgi:hypothetical protein
VPGISSRFELLSGLNERGDEKRCAVVIKPF